MIEWDDQYNVNIKVIDEQHKKIFDIINKYFEAVQRKDNDAGIKYLLSELTQYVLTHFKTEEEYLVKFNYKDVDAHKLEHMEFISKIKDVNNRVLNNEKIYTMDIGNYILNWIKNHIAVTDKKYSGFLLFMTWIPACLSSLPISFRF